MENIYEGMVYRPPSEGRSLIIQATIGCSHNTCRFCTMYRGKSFRLKSVKEIKSDLDKMKKHSSYYRRMFLADGDAMAMSTEDLLEILKYVKANFPEITRVGIYARADNLMGKTVEEMKQLKENGLNIVYVGLESGSYKVLELMDKGVTVEESIEGCTRAIAAGLKVSVMLISGLGGKKYLKEHAMESADMINKIQPHYLSLLTLLVDQRAPIKQDIDQRKFELLNPKEVMEETKLLIENLYLEKTIFRSNHASNYLALEGTLGQDKERLLKGIREVMKEESFLKESYRRL